MTTAQSVLVIVLALAFAAYIVVSARRARLDMRYAITWLAVSAGMLLIALFPGAVLWFAGLLGFEASTNMLFIAAIFVLAVLVFRQTMMLSKQDKRINKLTQTIALLRRKQEGSNEGQDKD